MGTGEEESISFFSILATGKHRLRFTTCLCQASRISQTCIFHANIKLSPPFFFFFLIGSHFLFSIKVYLINNVSGVQQSDSTVCIYIYSVKFSHSFVSDSLWPHGLQHNRLSITNFQAYSNSCPSSRWFHPLLSYVILCCPLLLPSQHQSLQMSQLITSGGQSIGVSASSSVLPMNIEDWFPLRQTGWISLQFKGLSRVYSNTTVQKHQFSSTQLSL